MSEQNPIQVEEDGDEIFTPKTCAAIVRVPHSRNYLVRTCGGIVRPDGGFHKCQSCGGSYGPVKQKAANA
jgi:hypothetical protein